MNIEAELCAPTGLFIVEDDPSLGWALRAMMEDSGYHVIGLSRTEDEAVRSARRLRPMAIIMDLKLAMGGSGIVAAHAIRRFSRAPIVFYTAYADLRGLAEQIREIGDARLVGKPDDKELRRVVDAFLSRGP
jgi:DNA-binding response OmpR family regulator